MTQELYEIFMKNLPRCNAIAKRYFYRVKHQPFTLEDAMQEAAAAYLEWLKKHNDLAAVVFPSLEIHGALYRMTAASHPISIPRNVFREHAHDFSFSSSTDLTQYLSFTEESFEAVELMTTAEECQLTRQERAVVRLLAMGLTCTDIASMIHLNVNQVRTIRKNIQTNLHFALTFEL